MQFYDATNKRAISQEIDRLCDSDDTSYPRLDKTARVNMALEELVGTIINSDGTWEWDDTNQTDLPVGTGTLVEAQETYTFASEYLEIRSIEILTAGSNSIYRKIDPIDYTELRGLGPQEYFGKNTTGMPYKYDLIGDSIRLYPAPTASAVTLASGIRVRFTRTALLFTPVSTTAADTTEPGLPSPYHDLLAYKASLPYCWNYKRDRLPWLESEIAKKEKELVDFYSHREKDKRKVMEPKPILYI